MNLNDLKNGDNKIEKNLNNIIDSNGNNTKIKETELKQNSYEEKNNEVEKSSTEQPIKKVYEVNYDDILNEKPVEKREVVESFFEKKDPIKELFSAKDDNITINKNNNDKYGLNNKDLNEKEQTNENNNSYKNLKPRSTIKTYNEALKNQENNKSENYFEEDKIKQFLNVREKLEVKTNIYLKNSIVIKLKELEERTNESRSSIINKLIEMALKNIE
ncbi:MAG: hypothetical protein K2F52_01435 [Malacoplasma sp.]|nr:hypothetical protein [Malacoplasma sp.]